MGLHRSDLKRRRRSDADLTRARNGLVKVKERARRDARMLETIKVGQLPYTPFVMSWLSRKLDKQAGKITPEDIKPLMS